MRKREEPPARWTLYGLPIQRGLALGIGAPLYLPTYGMPIWFDPRLFAQDEDEWLAIEYRMPTEPVEVIALVRDLHDVPPVLAPYVRIVGWIVERPPEPPLPHAPILQVPRLPPMLPPEAPVILDAHAGVAYIDPNATLLARYQSLLLRTATHIRYHLEGEHLPVHTWDDKQVLIGGVAPEWEAVAQIAQRGADLVWLTAETFPEAFASVAHALGGKPLWWFDPLARYRDDAHWQRLLRASAEMNLTLFVDSTETLAEARDSLEVAREALRAEHMPLGTPGLGLYVAPEASLPTVEPETAPLICWGVPKRTQRVAARLWQGYRKTQRYGIRRALLLPDAHPETLAIALGVEPYALFVPMDALPIAKQQAALLGVAECREWLLLRLRRWRDATLRAQPDLWLQQRR